MLNDRNALRACVRSPRGSVRTKNCVCGVESIRDITRYRRAFRRIGASLAATTFRTQRPSRRDFESPPEVWGRPAAHSPWGRWSRLGGEVDARLSCRVVSLRTGWVAVGARNGGCAVGWWLEGRSTLSFFRSGLQSPKCCNFYEYIERYTS